MAKNAQTSQTMSSLIVSNNHRPQRTVTFGNVTVTGDEPSMESVRDSLEKSHRAMQGLAKALLKPGIRLPERKNVPQFWIDENDTSVFVRRLNKKTERGRMVEGEFQVID